MLSINDDVDTTTAMRMRKSMATNRGDLIRLGDLNIQVPGNDEPGLFAVPIVANDLDGDIEWLLLDGGMNRLAQKSHIGLLVRWIVRSYGDAVSLTDCARGLLE
jgi:hypothetical protein